MHFLLALAWRAVASGERTLTQFTRRMFAALILGIVLHPGTARAGTIEIIDEMEATVQLAEPVDGIVVFNADNGEFVCAVAGIEVLVGMDANSIAYGEGGYRGNNKTICLAGQNQRSCLPTGDEERVRVTETLTERPGWSDFRAVQSGQVCTFNWFAADASSRAVGSRSIAKWLDPEAFADIDPSEAMRTWLEELQGVFYPGAYTYTTAQS